jgi:DNA-binding XRE family transcriptional regulator
MVDESPGRLPLWWQDSDSGVASNALLQAQLLGHICRCARALLDISQNELANAAGVSRRTIINVESGEITPDARTIMQLKDALHFRGIAVDLQNQRVSVSIPLRNLSPAVDDYVAQINVLGEIFSELEAKGFTTEGREDAQVFIQKLTRKLANSMAKSDEEYRTEKLQAAK